MACWVRVPGVTLRFLPILSKSRQPICCSNAFIEWLIADWERCSSFAVVVKLAVRARIEKARSCLLSSGCDMDEWVSSSTAERRKLFIHVGKESGAGFQPAKVRRASLPGEKTVRET